VEDTSMRVTWTPQTNSQRNALRQFPAWELVPGTIPCSVHGNLSWLIRPVGDDQTQDARWVRLDLIKEIR
jgi:hypothetical protein